MSSKRSADESLSDGLISQEEYDEFMDRMTRLSEMEDASSVDDMKNVRDVQGFGTEESS